MISFSEQIDKVLLGEYSESYLYIEDTPKILMEYGMQKLPMLITKKHVLTIMFENGAEEANYHGLGSEKLKQLPLMLSNPAMIMDSLTRVGCKVIVSDVLDNSGCPIIVSIKMNGYGIDSSNRRIEANIVTSAYGKENFIYWIEKNIQCKSIKYINNKKIKELQSEGVQFPNRL